MKNKSIYLCVLLFIGVLVNTSVAALIEWTVGSGGNGHFYEQIFIGGTIEWEDAKTDAQTKFHGGFQGFLTTITSQAENDFIRDNVLGTPPVSVSPFWIGGFQPSGSSEPDGGWTWITGETWSFTNWDSGEPSNSQGGTENAIEMLWESGSRNGTWNDNRSTISVRDGYIIEFVPEPATLTLLALGGLAVRRRRRAARR